MVKIFRAYKIEINLPNKIGMTFIFITVRVIVVPRIQSATENLEM